MNTDFFQQKAAKITKTLPVDSSNLERIHTLNYYRIMVTAKHLRDLMHTTPFKPFRVWMSDGTSHEVLNHDAAFVERSTFDIGINPDKDGIRADWCAVPFCTSRA